MYRPGRNDRNYHEIEKRFVCLPSLTAFAPFGGVIEFGCELTFDLAVIILIDDLLKGYGDGDDVRAAS